MEGNRAPDATPHPVPPPGGRSPVRSPRGFQSVLADRIRLSGETGDPFSLVLLRVDEPVTVTGGLDDACWHDRVGELLTGRIRTGDVLLPLKPGRFALLVDGRSGDTAERLAREISRLARQSANGAGDGTRFRVWAGTAVFPDDGTTVAELIKRAKSAFRPLPAATGDSDRDEATPLTILVVDDDQKTRGELGRVLRSLGHRVETADNGMAALLALRRTPCDAMFVDLRIPGTDGAGLVSKAVAFSPGLQVVAVADGADPGPVIDAMRAGACDCLLKPIEDPEAIADAARRVGDAVARTRSEARVAEDLRRENAVLRLELRLCRELSVRDEATGLYNGAYFHEYLGREVWRCRRHSRTFTAVAAGLRFGDGAADEAPVLRAVAEALRDGVRRSDVVARTGEREFALLLPETVSADGVRFVDKLLGELSGRVPDGCVDVRFGLASFPADAEDETGIVERARAALGRAWQSDTAWSAAGDEPV